MHIYTNGIKSGKLREVSVKHASIGKIFIKLEEFFKDHKRLSSFWAITEVRDQSFCINHVGHFSDDSLTKIANETILQFSEYFNQQRYSFNLPIYLLGTPFQQSVWKELIFIPYGQRRSYGDIARNLNRPKAYRAVGSANGKNPLPIIIPCHRVIKSNGQIGGFNLDLNLKQKLLALECEGLSFSKMNN